MPTAREKNQPLLHLVTEWRDRANDHRKDALLEDLRDPKKAEAIREVASVFDHCADRLEDALGKLL